MRATSCVTTTESRSRRAALGSPARKGPTRKSEREAEYAHRRVPLLASQRICDPHEEEPGGSCVLAQPPDQPRRQGSQALDPVPQVRSAVASANSVIMVKLVQIAEDRVSQMRGHYLIQDPPRELRRLQTGRIHGIRDEELRTASVFPTHDRPFKRPRSGRPLHKTSCTRFVS